MCSSPYLMAIENESNQIKQFYFTPRNTLFLYKGTCFHIFFCLSEISIPKRPYNKIQSVKTPPYQGRSCGFETKFGPKITDLFMAFLISATCCLLSKRPRASSSRRSTPLDRIIINYNMFLNAQKSSKLILLAKHF